MAVASAPQLTGKSLLGKSALLLQARAKARRGTSKLASAITDHAGTLAALGLIDAGLWQWSGIAGFIGAGVAVLVAELKIRG